MTGELCTCKPSELSKQKHSSSETKKMARPISIFAYLSVCHSDNRNLMNCFLLSVEKKRLKVTRELHLRPWNKISYRETSSTAFQVLDADGLICIGSGKSGLDLPGSPWGGPRIFVNRDLGPNLTHRRPGSLKMKGGPKISIFCVEAYFCKP